MSAAKLRSQLVSNLPLGDELRRAIAICDAWFDSEPTIGSFVVRSLLRDLEYRGWTDEQGVPKADTDAFEREYCPVFLARWTPGAAATLSFKSKQLPT